LAEFDKIEDKITLLLFQIFEGIMSLSIAEQGRNFARSASYAKYRLCKDVERFASDIGLTHRVLDIGSGTQTPYRSLFQAEHYFGLDYFESTHVSADATNLPFESKIASVVVATEVMEHLSEPQKALAEMNRVLETGGHLVLTVPLIWGVHDYIDYQRWTARGLAEMLTKHGFNVVQLKQRGGIFSMIGSMIGQIPMQLFGKMDGQNRLRSLIYIGLWSMLAPIQWILAPLDVLDKRRDFTVGYSLLCCKVVDIVDVDVATESAATESVVKHRNYAIYEEQEMVSTSSLSTTSYSTSETAIHIS